jgi:hypothetical protein
MRLLAEEVRRPFDLAAGPVVRALLVRLEEREHVLLVIFHHIAADGWSLGLFVRELSVFYAGQGSALAPLPVQYADFSVWQREWLTGPALEEQLAWWQDRLEGMPAALELPADRQRPAVQQFRGGFEPLTLPGADLRALARRRGATLFMTVLAGFAALLHRLTGEEDLAVGAPVAGRSHAELEGLIGLFVNTLPLRLVLTGEVRFEELVRSARETTLAAHAHQDVPFERLVEALQSVRDLSRSPLFQVLLAFQEDPGAALRLPGVTPQALPMEATHTGTAKFDLSLILAVTEGEMAGGLEYDSALFDPATVRRLAGHLRTLLAGAVAEPDRRLDELPLLTAEERAQISAWEGTAAPVIQHRGLHEAFWSRLASGRRPWRWCGARSASPTASWSTARASWRTSCCGTA